VVAHRPTRFSSRIRKRHSPLPKLRFNDVPERSQGVAFGPAKAWSFAEPLLSAGPGKQIVSQPRSTLKLPEREAENESPNLG